MSLQYSFGNSAMQTTAAPGKVTTSAAIKTLLQFKPLVACKIIEWGISFDGSAAAVPGVVELIETDVAATVTAFVTNDITRQNADAIQFGDPTTALISVGVAASGYTATVEGTTTITRDMDNSQLIAPTNQYVKQWPLGREPYCQAGKFYRVRVTFAVAINAICYMVVEI